MFGVVAEFVVELGERLEYLAVRPEALLNVLFEFSMVVLLLKSHRISGVQIGSEQAIHWYFRQVTVRPSRYHFGNGRGATWD